MIGTPNGGRSVDENTYKSLRAGKVASKNKNYSFYYNAPTLIIVSSIANYPNAMADSACAIENMLLASHYLNLGSCWINQVSWFDNNKNVRNFLTGLDIPENDKVCGSLCVGYRDGGMPVAQKRKENTVTIIK